MTFFGFVEFIFNEALGLLLFTLAAMSLAASYGIIKEAVSDDS